MHSFTTKRCRLTSASRFHNSSDCNSRSPSLQNNTLTKASAQEHTTSHHSKGSPRLPCLHRCPTIAGKHKGDRYGSGKSGNASADVFNVVVDRFAHRHRHELG